MSTESETREFNPHRLELARKRRGMTKVALAAEIGVTSRNLRRYQAGWLQPKMSCVEAMSSVLDFPIDFFFAPALDEIVPDNVSFRSLSRTPARVRDIITAKCTLTLDLSEWLESEFQLTNPVVPRYEVDDVELSAEEVRHRWGLGVQPIDDLLRVLERHGVRIFSLGNASTDVDAVSLWNEGIPYILLNMGKTPERTRMDVAHELGHLILHAHGGRVHDRNAEQEANAFASAFLMPRRGVIAVGVRRGATITEMIRLKRIWKVSLASLTYRLHGIGMLTRREYTARFVEIGRNDFRKREPDGMEHWETSSVLGKMFKALRDSGTPVWKIAQDLKVYPAEVYEMVYGLVPEPVIAPSTGITRSQQEMYAVSREHLAGPNPLDTTDIDNVSIFRDSSATPRKGTLA